MRKGGCVLIAAACVVLATSVASAGVLKPYVVLMLDTSGSMSSSTGAGAPSCGGMDNRLNHARCAINRTIANKTDMVFALGRFRSTSAGSYSTSCDANGNADGAGADQCTSTG